MDLDGPKMSNNAIDQELLTDLVRKYNVELLPNPIDRRAHWVKIAAEYNKACGTNISHQSLSKKLANIKQRDRQKLMAEKKKNLVLMKLGDNLVEVAAKEEPMSTDEVGRVEDDDEAEQMEAAEFVIEMEAVQQQQHVNDDEVMEPPTISRTSQSRTKSFAWCRKRGRCRRRNSFQPKASKSTQKVKKLKRAPDKATKICSVIS